MLFGDWQMDGWWYDYLAVLVIKTRLFVLFGCVVTLGWCAAGWFRGRNIDGVFPVLLMTLMLFALVSLHTGMNQHGRYILPALPFVLVLMCKGFTIVWQVADKCFESLKTRNLFRGLVAVADWLRRRPPDAPPVYALDGGWTRYATLGLQATPVTADSVAPTSDTITVSVR